VQKNIFSLKQRLLERRPTPAWSEKAEAFRVWEQSPFGTYLLEVEEQYCKEHLPNMPGYRAMQLGISEDFFLPKSFQHLHSFRIAATASATGNYSAISSFEALPLPSETVDVVVLHHVLEFSGRPHSALNEAARVLIAGGHLVLIGFNPWSLIGLRQWPGILFSTRNVFWHYQAISCSRVLDWLQLLGFQTHTLKFGGFELPVQSVRMLKKMRFMESAGSRLNLPMGCFYLIAARKQVLKPIWKPQPLWLEQKIPGFNTARESVTKNADSQENSM